MKKLTGFLTVILAATALAAFAETNAWQWESSLVPRAQVFEGLWSDFFQIVPALHHAGLPYTCVTVNELPPKDVGLPQAAVIVVANIAAPHLKPERVARIKEFVAAGGGLVVLAGRDAYSQGQYVGTPLGEILPVTFEGNDEIPAIPQGVLLARAASATWLPALDLAAKPAAFSVQAVTPKPGAVVQLLAGDKPAIVSGTFGKGRVVAVALTVNGNPPPGAVPFWEWPEWPHLLGQAIDWAAGARPLNVPGAAGLPVASKLKPLSNDELSEFALGLKTPDNVLARALAHPNAEVAEALFGALTAPDAAGKLTLAQALPVLLPYAKPAWGPRLVERTEALNPNHDDRCAALLLLGATRWPNALSQLFPALAKPETRQAALQGLGNSGDPKAIPALREAYADAIRAAQLPGETEYFNPSVFAHEAAAVAAESAVGLYRLGDPNAIARVLAMHRHVDLYWRIFAAAGRRELRNWADPIGQAFLKGIYDAQDHLSPAVNSLQHHDWPIPSSQVADFIKIAQAATDPLDVNWLVGELERSLSAFPPATWQPLTSAKDGIIARLARAAVAAPPAAKP